MPINCTEQCIEQNSTKLDENSFVKIKDTDVISLLSPKKDHRCEKLVRLEVKVESTNEMQTGNNNGEPVIDLKRSE
jgi:hypothetical protein